MDHVVARLQIYKTNFFILFLYLPFLRQELQKPFSNAILTRQFHTFNLLLKYISDTDKGVCDQITLHSPCGQSKLSQ